MNINKYSIRCLHRSHVNTNISDVPYPARARLNTQSNLFNAKAIQLEKMQAKKNAMLACSNSHHNSFPIYLAERMCLHIFQLIYATSKIYQAIFEVVAESPFLCNICSYRRHSLHLSIVRIKDVRIRFSCMCLMMLFLWNELSSIHVSSPSPCRLPK